MRRHLQACLPVRGAGGPSIPPGQASAGSRHPPAWSKWRARIVSGAAIAILAAAGAAAQTWTQPASNTAENLLDVVFSTTATAAAVGENDAIVVSGDGGVTWVDESLATGEDLQAVFSDGSTIVAVGTVPGGGPETIVDSPDGGATWAQNVNVPGIDEDLVDGLFVGSTAIAIDGDNGGGTGDILVSADRGGSWTNPFTAANPLNAIDARSSLVIAVGNNQGPDETVVRSTDGGGAWVAASSVPASLIDLFAVYIASTSTAVSVGSNGELILSTDAGDNWSQPASPVAADLNAVHGAGAYVVAVGDGGTVIRSTDYGATWAVAAGNPATENLNDVRFLTGTIALAVGDNGEILGSNDRGNNWTIQNGNTTEDLVKITFNGINNALLVGTNGIVLLSRDQISITEPIPFRSRGWLLLLLVGAGLWSLRRWQRSAA